ncbi:hypothetical protein NKJ06_03775 [Mesorhizobium sp. M0293]|uniref:hypothetical protein n=1 Tax=Mesorhizobium sp. M0293 TaxID=2956930 RepID=UPI00333A33BC
MNQLPHLGLIVLAAFQSSYKSQTGVDAPTRRAMRGIRRRARKAGMNEGQYFDEWIEWKRQRTKQICVDCSGLAAHYRAGWGHDEISEFY